ncbi:hypothetical protein CALCODRAFT_540626, partial [Calocera cornea HHB12733]
LLKREEDLAKIEERIVRAREISAERFRAKFSNTIVDYDHAAGDLVLLRNSANDGPLRDKALPRYIGPYIVLKRNARGSYILAELEGTVLRYAIAAFQVIPYHPRTNLRADIDRVLQNLDNLPYAVGDEGVGEEDEDVDIDEEVEEDDDDGADVDVSTGDGTD